MHAVPRRNPWLYQILTRLEKGAGRPGDLELMLDICANMKARTICPLSDAAAMPVESYIQKFYDEFAAHIRAAALRRGLTGARTAFHSAAFWRGFNPWGLAPGSARPGPTTKFVFSCTLGGCAPGGRT